VVGASNPVFIQNPSRFLASVGRDWSILQALRSKVLPSDAPLRLGQTLIHEDDD
jgi:hypothetical protein